MLIGPVATRAELNDFRNRIRAAPRNYIAQPVISLSTAPVLVKDRFEPRHLISVHSFFMGIRSACCPAVSRGWR